jgi:hypothetical protein
MLRARWAGESLRRINPLIPAGVALCGGIIGVSGHGWIGAGIAAGAVLALVNDIFLSRRVDFAADMRDLGRAMLIMQLGMLISCTFIGIATVVMVKISLAMAVAAAAGFAIAHLGTLAAFYWSRARDDIADGRQAPL